MQSANKKNDHSIYDGACPNCGATRSNEPAARCEICGSRDVVFPFGLRAGYLYQAEENQIILFLVASIVIFVIVILMVLSLALFQYREIFFALTQFYVLV
jgi:hypothetical protein